MDELFRMDVVDFSLPLEVPFMGEEADDITDVILYSSSYLNISDN